VRPLTEDDIRGSFVNATDRQLAMLTLPGLHETIWEEREYLGWRSAQSAHWGFIVQWLDDRPVGIVVRSSTTPMRQAIAAMCALCHSTQPATQVRLFTAPKAGEAGRAGDSLGSYICASLSCPHSIRLVPPHLATPAVIARRGDAMLGRLEAFTRRILATA
jgi:hypothetical protein